MGLRGRHIVGIADLARADLELLFRCADRFAAQPRGQAHLGRGYQLATLFFEPSTRTRLSFESAMNRLGGAVLTVADAAQSSVAKGETLADTIRVVSAYADIIALRHPREGAARLAADVATVPVVNAGDGAHEHPTQTLCDLYTLYRECGRVAGLTVTLYGDLKYGRTVHSLARGLACCGARLIFAPGDPALAPPAYLLDRLRAEYGCEPGWWFPDDGAPLPPTNALYLTRIQRERFAGHAAGVRAYPRVDRDLLRRWGADERTLLMHPLPRAGELDPALDGEARSAYFRQAANGVPVRMALLALLLGLAEEEWGSGGAGPRPAEACAGACATAPRHPGYRAAGVACANPACVSRHEPAAGGPRFDIAGLAGDGLDLRCRYCEHPARAAGAVDLAARAYRPAGDPGLRALLATAPPEDVLLAATEEDALAAGVAAPAWAVRA
ncbi:MAG TPA: aspartate carbamoyltransferase [Thermomicrobiales bacterium]|nr:aspartate carbamoyltransferase [Thermomicrobiales bacterium]